MIYNLWKQDKRVLWKAAPKPTMADSMYNKGFWYELAPKEREDLFNSTLECSLNETEMAFDAADIIKVGKDIFLRKSQTANFLAVEWLRREFPHLRVHAAVHRSDYSRHYDEHWLTLRTPSAGSEGIVLVNKDYLPMQETYDLWANNDWKIYPVSFSPPTDGCLVTKWNGLAMNSLSLSEKCVLIEEQQIQYFNLLEELGFDVITVPLTSMNEFGGSVHCSTIDVKRDDDLKDFFPDQNYELECEKGYPTVEKLQFVDFKE